MTDDVKTWQKWGSYKLRDETDETSELTCRSDFIRYCRPKERGPTHLKLPQLTANIGLLVRSERPGGLKRTRRISTYLKAHGTHVSGIESAAFSTRKDKH